MDLKLGFGNYEGKEYEYLYVNVLVNGKEKEIKLKPYSTLEKGIVIDQLKGEEEIK